MNILDRLSIESDGTVQSRTGNVTIGFLTKTIGEKFKCEMDIESFDQESSEVIFPIMFCIQMNPDDYEARTPFLKDGDRLFWQEFIPSLRRKSIAWSSSTKHWDGLG